MNVNLTPALEEFVRVKVSSGLYNNASEVIREALRRAVQADEYERLKREIAVGAEQLAAGLGKPLDMAAARKRAVEASKAGRKVKPFVTP